MADRQTHITDLDPKAGTFKLDGTPYSTAGIPDAVKPELVTLALSQILARAKEPGKVFRELCDGKRTFSRASKAPAFSEWHVAAAGAHALGVVKANGIKAKPGKSLRDSEEYGIAFNAALNAAAPWSRKKTDEAKRHPAIAEEYRRITGAAPASMEALFGAPVVLDQPDAAELERAA